MSYPLTPAEAAALKTKMRTVPDFPKPGIKFKDLSTLLIDPTAMEQVYEALAAKCKELKPDCLALLEARGFLVGTPVAMLLKVGTVMIRKPGKLPGELVKYTYDLEYGSDTLTLQKGLIELDSRVLIIDDLLATAGTACAALTLLEQVGANVVGAGFISELTALGGRKKFPPGVDVFSLVEFDADMN